MSKNDGGPAFPLPFASDPDTKHWTDGSDAGVPTGLTIRDWFAGKAMQVLFTANPNGLYALHAKDAYKIADAMLAERDK